MEVRTSAPSANAWSDNPAAIASCPPGIPTLVYGLAATRLVRHCEIVRTPRGDVTIYFLLPEDKGSRYWAIPRCWCWSRRWLVPMDGWTTFGARTSQRSDQRLRQRLRQRLPRRLLPVATNSISCERSANAALIFLPSKRNEAYPEIMRVET